MEHNKLLYGTAIGMHTHVCGQTKRSEREIEIGVPAVGCGHTWHHDGWPNQGLPDDEYHAVHACPNCGAGPWLAIHNKSGPYKSISNAELVAAVSLASAGDDELLIDTLLKMAMYELAR